MKPNHWDRKDLLGLQELEASEIEALLDAAASFKDSRDHSTLKGRRLAFLFSEPSTRTRSSFEVAARRLGADVLSFSAATSSQIKGESLLDTIENLGAMGVEYFVCRQEEPGVLETLAPATKASLINAGDGAHEHPTQALLDLFTLRERKGRIKDLRVVIVGDVRHSRVARSNLHGLLKLGASLTFCGPRALLPDSFAALGVSISRDLDAAVAGADAVYALRLQLERQNQNLVTSLPDYALSWGLDARRLAKAGRDCLVLDAGPVNRGVQMSSEVADGPQSAILEQVANGVAVRMAVLSSIEGWRRRHAR